MTALHSTKFFSGRLTTTPVTPLYTVPVGKRIVIKHVAIQNMAGTTKQYFLNVDGAWLIMAPNLPALGLSGSNLQLSTWIPLNAGQVIGYSCAAGGQCDLSVGGYLYFV